LGLAQAKAHGAVGEISQVGACGGLPQDQKLFDDRLMSALKSIEDIARACLLLRTIEGLDYTEISQLLDIPKGTAMSHVYRTRRALRKMLSDEPAPGVGPTEVAS
jgi:RNA polymerase sigma-70 factor (ECF subfamily)